MADINPTAGAAEAADAPKGGSKGSVLLVDDDKFLIEMYAMKFTAGGYTVEACLSADDALHSLRNGFTPDAIVFDLLMPEHDGFSFLESLGRENLARNSLRIALTNESEETVKKKAIDCGANLVIVKATMIPTEVTQIVGEEIAKKQRA